MLRFCNRIEMSQLEAVVGNYRSVCHQLERFVPRFKVPAGRKCE